jgi:hypothetical protein
MIQRIQTLLLFLAFVALLLMFFFPIATFLSEENFVCFKLYVTDLIDETNANEQLYNVWFMVPMMALIIITGFVSFLGIFYFKKRPFQIKITGFAILMNIALIVLIFFYADKISGDFGAVATYKLASVFPLISLLLLIFANRAIRRDEKLVRSMDRLR